MSARERFRQVLAGIPTLGRTTTAGARRNSRRIARRKTVERFIARREEGKRVFPARFRLDFGKGRSCGTNGRTIVALKSISSNNRDLSIREVGTSTREKKRVDETRDEGRGEKSARMSLSRSEELFLFAFRGRTVDEITANFLVRGRNAQARACFVSRERGARIRSSRFRERVSE